jgi:rhodanese-related sulfurtransferase
MKAMWDLFVGRPAPGDGAAAGVAGDGGQVKPAEARRRALAGNLLLDVREPAEWSAGHAPGAVPIPLGQLSARLSELPRDREIIAVCRSGNRSGVAAGLLRRAGFSKAVNMAGGMMAWTKQGLPVER